MGSVRLDIAIEAHRRVERAKRTVERLEKELNAYVVELSPEELSEYVKATEEQ